MTKTSILGYFGVRNLFLTIDLKNAYVINVISKMAALNLHDRMGNFDILCQCCSYKGILIIIIYSEWVNNQI